MRASLGVRRWSCAIAWMIAAAVMMGSAHEASAGLVYTGQWHNTTFDSTGSLMFELDLTDTTFAAVLTVGGNVFGLPFPPPPIVLAGDREPDGGAVINVTGHLMGDISGTVNGAGVLNLVFSNIPGGFIRDMTVSGLLTPSLLSGTYRVEFPTPRPEPQRQEGIDFALGPSRPCPSPPPRWCSSPVVWWD
jgi:hypothetical protein